MKSWEGKGWMRWTNRATDLFMNEINKMNEQNENEGLKSINNKMIREKIDVVICALVIRIIFCLVFIDVYLFDGKSSE